MVLCYVFFTNRLLTLSYVYKTKNARKKTFVKYLILLIIRLSQIIDDQQMEPVALPPTYYWLTIEESQLS